MDNCIFCKIIAGIFPSECVYEDELVFAFRDVVPQAPTHILVVPKAHIESAADIAAENSGVVARCFEVLAKLARDEGLSGGFRIVTNSGHDAGQTVNHLHFHLLGGEELGMFTGKPLK